MTPKEKAIEILGKYEGSLMYDKSVTELFPVAKKCALLAIDEILEVTKEPVFPMGGCTGYDYDNFWLEVKDEMGKL